MLSTLQQFLQDPWGAFLAGGTFGLFLLILAVFILGFLTKTLVAAWENTVKAYVEKNRQTLTICFGAIALTGFTRHYWSLFAVLVLMLLWGLWAVLRPGSRPLATVLFIVLVCAAYGGEEAWRRRERPQYAYVVLSFENRGAEDWNTVLYNSWSKFRGVLADVFAGLPRVRVRPESLDQKIFDSLSLAKASRQSVVAELHKKGFGGDLILRGEVEVEPRDKVRVIRLLCTLNRVAKSDLYTLDGIVLQRGTLDDIEHVALMAALDLMARLRSDSKFGFPIEDHVIARKNLLRCYQRFLAFRSPVNPSLAAEITRALESPDASESEVRRLLTAYVNPIFEQDGGAEAEMTRKALLAKVKVTR